MQKKGESQREWDLLGVGENSVDLVATLPRLPQGDGKAALTGLQELPGGQVATALAAAAQLGLRTACVGTFGDDPAGRLVQQSLTDRGVDTSACRTVTARTRTAVILVETEVHTRMVLARRDPALDWAGAPPVHLVTRAKALLVDMTDLRLSVAMAAAARAVGVLTVADVDHEGPGLTDLLPHIDVLVVSEGLRGRLRELQAAGPRLAVATLGAAGAVVWDGRRQVHVPGFPVDVVDTTGAGDVFRAALITHLVDPVDPVDLVDLVDPVDPVDPVLFANAAAALSCRGLGAQGALPTRDEVERLLTSARGRQSKQAWDTPGRSAGEPR